MNGMQALRVAAPYLHKFRGETFVVKLGGEALDDPATLARIAEQVSLLWHLGIRLILVHGGGAALDRLSGDLGLEVNKVDGRRVTDEPTLEAVTMTLTGSVHVRMIGALRKVGLKAVGVSGQDAGLITSVKRPVEPIDFGHVGDVERVDADPLQHLLAGGYLPVVAPLTATEEGEPLNTNADTVAAHVAGAVSAEKIFFLLGQPGLLREKGRPETLIPFLTPQEMQGRMEDGTASEGMLPKLAAARVALDQGVTSAHLIGAQVADSLLLEVFTNEGSGTMIGQADS